MPDRTDGKNSPALMLFGVVPANGQVMCEYQRFSDIVFVDVVFGSDLLPNTSGDQDLGDEDVISGAFRQEFQTYDHGWEAATDTGAIPKGSEPQDRVGFASWSTRQPPVVGGRVAVLRGLAECLQLELLYGLQCAARGERSDGPLPPP